MSKPKIPLILLPSFVLGRCIGVLYVGLKRKQPIGDGPFCSSTIFSVPGIMIEMITIFVTFKFIQIEIAYTSSLWPLATFLIFETQILFIFWVFNNSRKNVENVLNQSYQLMRTDPRRFPYSIGLIYIPVTFFILKAIVVYYAFVILPYTHTLLYMAFTQSLAFESVFDALTAVVEVSMTNVNDRLRAIQREDEISKRLKPLIVLRWKTDELARNISKIFGPTYFLLVIANVPMGIFVLSDSFKRLLSPVPAGYRIGMYANIVEWHLPIYSLCLICRRSNRLYNLSQDTVRYLQMLMRIENNHETNAIILQFMRSINADNCYLTAGNLQQYNYGLLLTILSLLITNILAMLQGST